MSGCAALFDEAAGEIRTVRGPSSSSVDGGRLSSDDATGTRLMATRPTATAFRTVVSPGNRPRARTVAMTPARPRTIQIESRRLLAVIPAIFSPASASKAYPYETNSDTANETITPALGPLWKSRVPATVRTAAAPTARA